MEKQAGIFLVLYKWYCDTECSQLANLGMLTWYCFSVIHSRAFSWCSDKQHLPVNQCLLEYTCKLQVQLRHSLGAFVTVGLWFNMSWAHDCRLNDVSRFLPIGCVYLYILYCKVCKVTMCSVSTNIKTYPLVWWPLESGAVPFCKLCRVTYAMAKMLWKTFFQRIHEGNDICEVPDLSKLCWCIVDKVTCTQIQSVPHTTPHPHLARSMLVLHQGEQAS